MLLHRKRRVVKKKSNFLGGEGKRLVGKRKSERGGTFPRVIPAMKKESAYPKGKRKTNLVQRAGKVEKMLGPHEGSINVFPPVPIGREGP